MIKRRQMQMSIKIWWRSFSLYWNAGLWRDTISHVQRHQFTATAAEVSFFWLLALVLGSFIVLQGVEQRYLSLPSMALQVARLMQTMLSVVPKASEENIGRTTAMALGVIAWLFLVTGTGKLTQAVSRAYGSSLNRRSRWVNGAINWLITALILAVVSLVLGWLGTQDISNAVPPEETLKLSVAEGAEPMGPDWRDTLWQILRWPSAIATLGLTLAAIYRLAPQRWTRGMPIGLGVGLALMLGAGSIGCSQWWIKLVPLGKVAYGQFLVLGVGLLLLYWLILLVPVGAQFNVSAAMLRSARGISFGQRPSPPPPPSFESFEIKRRSD